MNTKHNVHLLTDTLHRTITNITITPSAMTNIRQNLPGYPSGGGTGGGTKLNDDGTPPGNDRHIGDPVTRDNNEINRIIERMHADSIRLNVLLTEWTTTTDKTGDTNGSDCEACGVHIVKPERPRAGLCNACRMSWKRWLANGNNPDRHEWMWQRRRVTANEQNQTDGTNGTNKT